MKEFSISWQAPAHEYREHTADWYWAVSIITVSLAAAFIIVGNMLLSLILLIGIGTLLYHAKHPPHWIDCEISRKGIRSDDRFYPWHSLEAFWILEEHKTEWEYIPPKLLLISEKHFMPQIVIPLDNAPLEEIHHVLSQKLHEVPQTEPLPSRLMRKLGF